MKHIGKKNRHKTAVWKFATAYEVYGGDFTVWASHGDPVVAVYCSNCGNEARVKKGREIGPYGENVLMKKRCPDCGCKMQNHD